MINKSQSLCGVWQGWDSLAQTKFMPGECKFWEWASGLYVHACRNRASLSSGQPMLWRWLCPSSFLCG